ncbi:MAG: cupin [Microthrixaceae bacterium]
MSQDPVKISSHPIHLGLGATAEVEPEFTGEMAWYEGYADRHSPDGVEGRLVTMHTFTESWDVWEMHPQGSEVVLCVAGAITLFQQAKGYPQAEGADVVAVTLAAGEYVVNDPGTWHTADVDEEATALFITAGAGTEHRPR